MIIDITMKPDTPVAPFIKSLPPFIYKTFNPATAIIVP